MKKYVFLLILTAVATFALAYDGVSLEKGRELFSSKKLGTNGKTCNFCHSNGKGLEKASLYDDGELGTIINQCVTISLNGEILDPESTDMKSLIIYIKSIGHIQ